MKISHRDFRPPRRSKYVTQPVKRRPTLRILLLAGIGIAVYLKFDSVVSSRLFQRLRKPKELFSALPLSGKAASENPAQPIKLKWSADSGMAEADCPSARIDSCLDGLGMDAEALGTLRAILQKAAVQWDLDFIGGFSARFLRSEKEADLLHPKGTKLELSGLDLRTAHGSLQLAREPGKEQALFCAAGKCLDAVNPQAPFAYYRNPPPGPDPERVSGAAFIPLQASPAKAVLPGRIVAVPQLLDRDWLEIYHGGNLFSFYRGFSRLHAGLKAGSQVNAQDTLGFVEAPDSAAIATRNGSIAGLEVRLEKDGLRLDPIAWLGTATQTGIAGTAHGR